MTGTEANVKAKARRLLTASFRRLDRDVFTRQPTQSLVDVGLTQWQDMVRGRVYTHIAKPGHDSAYKYKTHVHKEI